MPFILFTSCKMLQFVHFALFTLTAHNYSSRENGNRENGAATKLQLETYILMRSFSHMSTQCLVCHCPCMSVTVVVDASV